VTPEVSSNLHAGPHDAGIGHGQETRGWLALLHPVVYQEVQSMAKQSRTPLQIDLNPIIESMGMRWVIEELGSKRVIEELGAKRVIEELGSKQVIDDLVEMEQVWEDLTPEQRRKLKRRLQE
jgi:hypothetical protein